jgi:hypothetical protein
MAHATLHFTVAPKPFWATSFWAAATRNASFSFAAARGGVLPPGAVTVSLIQAGLVSGTELVPSVVNCFAPAGNVH